MSDVILVAGTTVEMQLADNTWQLVPQLTQLGAVGEQSDPKEKTTLSDKIKKYGSGLRDAPDKNIQGQYIPTQVQGDEHYDNYVLQQAFITRCRNEEEFNMRVNWPDGDVTGFLFKALGFEYNDVNQEEWKMFTVNGKQNSRVINDVTVAGSATVAAGDDITLTASWTPSTITETDAGGVIWRSADDNTATVTDAGVVTGVAAGNVEIYAEVRGVVGTLEVEVTA